MLKKKIKLLVLPRRISCDVAQHNLEFTTTAAALNLKTWVIKTLNFLCDKNVHHLQITDCNKVAVTPHIPTISGATTPICGLNLI